jgi:Lipase (class 3)
MNDKHRKPRDGESFLVQGLTAEWIVPIRVSIQLGQPYPASSPPDHKAGAIGVDREGAVEGLFGAAEPDVAPIAYAHFSKQSLVSPGLDWMTAMSAADLSHLAYEDRIEIRRVCRDLFKLENTEFVQGGETQCFVASTDKAVVVAFRGTKELMDWFSNLNVLGTTTNYGTVHRGFHQAFTIVRDRLRDLVDPLIAGRKLLLTGHSLGGALATIAAAEWRNSYPIASVYTYGQPCVGGSAFQALMNDEFAGRFFRFVNADDIVPRVPPGYKHIGRRIKFNDDGDVIEDSVESVVSATTVNDDEQTLSMAEFEYVKEMARNQPDVAMTESTQLEGLLPNYFSDHKMQGYLKKILGQLPPQ